MEMKNLIYVNLVKMGLILVNYNNIQKCESVREIKIKENCLEYDAYKCFLCKNGYKLYNGTCLLINRKLFYHSNL